MGGFDSVNSLGEVIERPWFLDMGTSSSIWISRETLTIICIFLFGGWDSSCVTVGVVCAR